MSFEISTDLVYKIAELGRLNLKPEEVDGYREGLQKILATFETLDETHEVWEGENYSTPTDNLLASDVPINSISTKDFLAGLPSREGVFARVPAILNDE